MYKVSKIKEIRESLIKGDIKIICEQVGLSQSCASKLLGSDKPINAKGKKLEFLQEAEKLAKIRNFDLYDEFRKKVIRQAKKIGLNPKKILL